MSALTTSVQHGTVQQHFFFFNCKRSLQEILKHINGQISCVHGLEDDCEDSNTSQTDL